MNSYYTWKGKLEVAREYLLVMKTNEEPSCLKWRKK